MKAATPIRRSRSNDGTPNRMFFALPIDPRLLASLLAEFAAPAERRAPAVYHGPKKARGCPRPRLSDEQVLAIRKMRDWLGMTESQIAEQTGLSIGSIAPLTGWKNRVHLDPGPRPLNARAQLTATAEP